MARVVWILVAIMVFVAVSHCSVPGKRTKRGYNSGYNSGYGDSSSGYGRGSDERDASVSEEGTGCGGSNGGGGYGRGYSGSRELAYNRDGRSSDTRGGRSFTKSSASAVASATAYSMNQRANIV